MPANASFLKEIPLFQTMDEQECDALASMMEEVHFDANTQLFFEKDAGGICYILRKGRIELSVVDEAGDKLVVDVLGSGELCGELSLLDGGTRSTNAFALSAVEALALKRPELLNFLNKQPHAAIDLLSALAKRIRRADALLKQRIQDPNKLIAEQRTLGDRMSDAMAGFGGSWRFVLMFLGGMLCWVLLNAFSGAHFDPFPFILLNLMLSMVAALQAPIIMMSQNRQDAKDRIRSEADYRVNLRSEVEIAELHEKMDALRGELNLQLQSLSARLPGSAGPG